MNIIFDHGQLLHLLTSLHTISGIHASLFDARGKDSQIGVAHAPFCQLINSCPEGHRRCLDCDQRVIREHGGQSRLHGYRCHAGVREAIMPIHADGTPLAYLIFGQFLDSAASREEQWEQARPALSWYPGDIEALHRAFLQLPQYSDRQIAAYSEILEALASYIQLKGLILPAAQTDLQRLARYLDQHYTEKLSLATISADLRIGRTKLCALAKTLSGGHSLSYIITQRRVNAAKTLLLQSGDPISAVAEAVGISDYNYFSKVFHQATGMTPSAFRRQGGAGRRAK